MNIHWLLKDYKIAPVREAVFDLNLSILQIQVWSKQNATGNRLGGMESVLSSWTDIDNDLWHICATTGRANIQHPLCMRGNKGLKNYGEISIHRKAGVVGMETYSFIFLHGFGLGSKPHSLDLSVAA